jgi:primosomal protein N'
LRPLLDDSMRMRGPAPCPIARLSDKHRHQIELTAPSAGDMQRFMTRARNEGILRPGASMVVDVDPIALL